MDENMRYAIELLYDGYPVRRWQALLYETPLGARPVWVARGSHATNPIVAVNNAFKSLAEKRAAERLVAGERKNDV